MLGYSDDRPSPAQPTEPSSTPPNASSVNVASLDLTVPVPAGTQEAPVPPVKKVDEPCFSCKVIGTTTLGAGAAWSAYQTVIFSNKVHRKFKLNVLLGGFSVSGIFLTLMYYRWYDIAVFSPRREGEDFFDKIQRITNEDLDTLRAFNANVKSIFLGSDSKNDKD